MLFIKEYALFYDEFTKPGLTKDNMSIDLYSFLCDLHNVYYTSI